MIIAQLGLKQHLSASTDNYIHNNNILILLYIYALLKVIVNCQSIFY